MTGEFETGVDWTPEPGEIDQEYYDRLRQEFSDRRKLTRKVREGYGLSQTEAAQILGITRSNLSKIESAPEPRLYILEKLVAHFGGKLRLIAQLSDGRAFDIVSGEGVSVVADRPKAELGARLPTSKGPK